MSLLWKVATSPTIEEEVRESFTKKSLTDQLGQAIRNLQQENIENNAPVIGGDNIVRVCNCLEAIFIHGLKDRLVSKVSAVFSNNYDKMPEPNFWPVITIYSHKDVLSQINHLTQVNTDVGRCRAWLRLALNDGLITSYIEAMIQDKPTLQYYYRSTAYLQDPEQPDIMKTYLDGLSIFDFQLTYNCVMLNTWSPVPLMMSGIWMPPPGPEPVMPAMDVVHFFSQEYKPKTKKIVENVEQKVSDSKDSQIKESVSSDDKEQQDSLEVPTKEYNSKQCKIKNDITSDSYEAGSCSNDIEDILVYEPAASPNSVPDLDLGFGETTSDSVSLEDTLGNRISRQGWSSSFDQEENAEKKDSDNSDSQSYDSLLQSYNRNRNKPVVGTPEIAEFMTSVKISDEADVLDQESKKPSSVQSKELSLEALEYEVIPKTYVYTSENTDEFTKNLLSVLGKICPEKGQDQQNYKCHNCECPLGMIYGEAKICSYDGYNYCSECHENDVYYIPAKIIHNWDFEMYPVSKHAKRFLLEIETQPLLDLKTLNPSIYSVIEEMSHLQMLRTQLGFLKSYLFTCRESIAEELRQKIWPREHLYEHIHLYSLADLLQVPNNKLANTLQKLISFAKKHVLNCQLCKLKGFICEICNNPKVIYPFEIDTTYQCEHCLAVYHSLCMSVSKPCPKCERKQKRFAAKDFTWLGEDGD
ncbi:uncharacterized protein LOC111618214 [Centruroides sculpturatus]|uniref:uncharacterized protein LOC111618214 n=1 Tax=Centruroides sculpturatus TaxID=218467 RepID=UPI000C6CFBF0|nr:uncharacterized protein LOC111618214 [Centruroides sculpturatus]